MISRGPMTANAARAFLLLVTLTACEGGATKTDLTQSAPSTASDAVADRAAVELTPSRAGLGGVAGQAVSESKIAAPLPAASAAPASPEAQSPSSGAVTQE